MAEKAKGYDKAVELIGGELAPVLSGIRPGKKNSIQEIRLRSDRPVVLTDGTDTIFINKDSTLVYTPGRDALMCSRRFINDTFKRLCGYSVYSRQPEINSGYITVSGGCRVGLCGTAATENGRILSVSDITSLDIRISRQIFGVSEKLIRMLFPISGGILIAGAPSTGKTTILRDIAYRISQGIGCRAYRTCVIDERMELSGGRNEDMIDLGLSDIMRGYPKSEGFSQAVRALSPQVIICDESGTEEDMLSLIRAANAGVFIIATIHASSYGELMRKRGVRRLISYGVFSTVVILSSSDHPSEISEIHPIGGEDLCS